MPLPLEIQQVMGRMIICRKRENTGSAARAPAIAQAFWVAIPPLWRDGYNAQWCRLVALKSIAPPHRSGPAIGMPPLSSWSWLLKPSRCRMNGHGNEFLDLGPTEPSDSGLVLAL